MEPTFKVATQIGWFDDVFVLPDRVYPPQPPIKGMPPGWSRILVHLDAKDEDIHSRFHCSGSIKKSQEIFRLCRGNSRLMFAAALSFVGPCCKLFGLRAPGVQSSGGAAFWEDRCRHHCRRDLRRRSRQQSRFRLGLERDPQRARGVWPRAQRHADGP